jgi:hypothetical protein
MENEEQNIVLEFGGEGGSIKLVKIEKDYYFTTNESVWMDLLPDEFTEDELVSTSEPFDNFDLAFEMMKKKYNVFWLYPLHVNPDFKDIILKYFHEYLNYTIESERGHHIDDWKRILIEKQ